VAQIIDGFVNATGLVSGRQFGIQVTFPKVTTANLDVESKCLQERVVFPRSHYFGVESWFGELMFLLNGWED
jgi:hypothetical protein